ncbi:MAG: hypothetical protein JOZ74_05010 [Bradyrhizobium sp.]|nr:hypothetical protein [Bradyrhizobium sp.]
MDCLYQGYRIESFEAGRDLWHARIRRADGRPLVIGSHPFAALEVGFAWNDSDSAISDAKRHIERFKHRWSEPGEIRAA